VLTVRELLAQDWPEVKRIFAEGIATGHATFETAVPDWAAFDRSRLPHLRLVAPDPQDPGRLLGWTAASPVSARPVYAGVAEHAVYVSAHARGGGVGRLLLEAMIQLSEAGGVWSLRSGVFTENLASRGLHRQLGFREVGILERVGRGGGRWRDVVLVERRSPSIGDDSPLVRLTLPGRPADLDAVRHLLADSGLPPLGEAWRTWVADAAGTGGEVVGCAALERYPRGSGSPVYLLRSVAVAAGRRGTGVGRRLVEAALTTADLHDGHRATVGLLTETADGWFDRFGFAAVPRDQLPAELAASPELRGACPDTARAYLRR